MAQATETRAERTITLELSEREAALILFLAGHVVTGPTGGPRGHADEIYAALKDRDLPLVAIKSAVADDFGTHFNNYPEGFAK